MKCACAVFPITDTCILLSNTMTFLSLTSVVSANKTLAVMFCDLMNDMQILWSAVRLSVVTVDVNGHECFFML